jgi:hypothetical protein
MRTAIDTRTDAETLAAKFIEFLETDVLPEGLFAEDVFADFTLPQWRVQTEGVDSLVSLRRTGYSRHGTRSTHRLDATARGFVLEFEERWTDDTGEQWYGREMLRADVAEDGLIHELSVYCSGDWDAAQVGRHQAAVTLIRP